MKHAKFSMFHFHINKQQSMKLVLLFILLITFNSCNLIRLLNTSERNDESTEEINSFLSKRKYHFDYSFKNIDSTSYLLDDSNFRLNDSSHYSAIQLRIYDSVGDFYSGYSQCMGSFYDVKAINKLPPPKNLYPYLNTNLKFKDELELIEIDSETKLMLLESPIKYDYIFVVYWTAWSNSFSKRLLQKVSKIKKKNQEKVLVILINIAKDRQVTTPND